MYKKFLTPDTRYKVNDNKFGLVSLFNGIPTFVGYLIPAVCWMKSFFFRMINNSKEKRFL